MLFGPFAAMFVFCYLVTHFFISRKWAFYDEGFLSIVNYSALHSHNVLSRSWPEDAGFLSLKFSALRHTVAALVSAVLIWFLDIRFFNTLLLSATAIYICPCFLLYRARVSDYQTAPSAAHEFLKPVKQACLSVLICAIADYLILLTVYGMRP